MLAEVRLAAPCIKQRFYEDVVVGPRLHLVAQFALGREPFSRRRGSYGPQRRYGPVHQGGATVAQVSRQGRVAQNLFGGPSSPSLHGDHLSLPAVV
ncbi:MAG: hypothetical protein R3300_20735 [Candidatus Promineifilaceae bacterium]|nr:hypothetical protein [Candidatus Promineifilaceae bacterium]